MALRRRLWNSRSSIRRNSIVIEPPERVIERLSGRIASRDGFDVQVGSTRRLRRHRRGHVSRRRRCARDGLRRGPLPGVVLTGASGVGMALLYPNLVTVPGGAVTRRGVLPAWASTGCCETPATASARSSSGARWSSCPSKPPST